MTVTVSVGALVNLVTGIYMLFVVLVIHDSILLSLLLTCVQLLRFIRIVLVSVSILVHCCCWCHCHNCCWCHCQNCCWCHCHNCCCWFILASVIIVVGVIVIILVGVIVIVGVIVSVSILVLNVCHGHNCCWCRYPQRLCCTGPIDYGLSHRLWWAAILAVLRLLLPTALAVKDQNKKINNKQQKQPTTNNNK